MRGASLSGIDCIVQDVEECQLLKLQASIAQREAPRNTQTTAAEQVRTLEISYRHRSTTDAILAET